MNISQQQPMSLAKKLVEIRRNIGGFTKDTKGYNYSYVSGSQVLTKIQHTMNELGVLLIPKVLDQQFKEHPYKDKYGKDKLDFIVYGSMSYVWMNADDPKDIIEVPFYYTGAQDDVSKAFGSGLTYSERYFIIKFFNLPTDSDDPDARNTSGRSQNQGYPPQGNNQQMQQQAQQGQSSQPGLRTQEQFNEMAQLLSEIATVYGSDPNTVYNGAMQKCSIPDKISDLLTSKEAKLLIDYLRALKMQVAQ
ncbi:ERF family protein [Lysinibacillus macroides]|uniref:ERF family protein n=1 Tax=Lysinibacillus macroides TaxID=33935 RepID=UPI0006B596ED|nr:ERF family protein [Lysinibacillus macroides]QPR69610.1 ERF family protein [Lysinibacillus macroides]